MDGLEKPAHLQRVEAVIFDFDGTLAVLNIDFSLMRNRVFQLIKRYGVNENSIRERYVLEIIDEVYQILQQESHPMAEEFYRESHGVLHEIEMEAAGRGSLIPGTEVALRNLRGKGMKVGIITRNCEDAVREVFPNIDDCCDVFVSRNSVKKVKPHPDHLTAAMNRLGVTGEKSVMVGDHLIDIQAGKRVGMRTIGVLTGRITREEFEKADADYILEDAKEISKLLEE